MKKRIVKVLKFISVFIALLLIMALIFPTWTSKIDGNDSISELSKIEINGTNHEHFAK